MSQEINLLNPDLRPKFDWLAFRPLAAAVLLVAILVAAGYVHARYRADAALLEQRAASARLSALQQHIQELQSALAGRQPSPSLIRDIEYLSAETARRRHVLKLAEEAAAGGDGGRADVMRGFSRQVTGGVWLTGFAIGNAGIDIRGRLLDPGLLPAYIRRLNGEPAFRGRRFAALDMQEGGQPAGNAASASGPAATLAFTEFSLRASAPRQEGGGE